MASNYKALYGIFYKISMEVVKSEILNKNDKQHNMASNYKALYGIFYKISMEVVKSEILNKNGLPYPYENRDSKVT